MESSLELSLALAGLAVLLAAGAVLLVARERVRDRRERDRMQRHRELGLHLPASLHPVIDPDACIGAAACVAACPEQDVLGLVGGAGRLVHGAACIGHGRCALECPVDAIRLVFGTEERGVDIPFVTPDYETNRAGIYIAGELGGMGLIRNAIRQGVGAGRHAARRAAALPRGRDGAVDVAVVGAGPAGIAAALACMEAGASYALIEQASLGGSVTHYPRHKVVMTEPVEVPIFGRIHRAEISKEELLELWRRVVADTGLELRAGVTLEDVQGEDGDFELVTSAGTLWARKVVLAVGRRGSPRRLGVPGEESPSVVYRVVDPEQYRGHAVLVVGGGDSALEAAVALAAEPDTRVTLAYRGEGFFRAKQANRDAVERLASAGSLAVALMTTVERLEPERAVLKGPAGRRELEADYVVAALGGELPSGLLDRLGIRVDRWLGAPPRDSAPSTRIAAPSAGADHPAYLAFAAGAAVLASLAWMGREYYALDVAARELSALHARWRSSGSWGHGIGLAATAVMLTNFLYAARKRLAWLRHFGRLRAWLGVHAAVGLLAPGFIAVHAAFDAKNLIAAATYAALGAVVATGVVGRFVYVRVRSQAATAGAGARAALFLRAWRTFHVLLALLLVLTIGAHVAVSLLFGYRWVL